MLPGFGPITSPVPELPAAAEAMVYVVRPRVFLDRLRRIAKRLGVRFVRASVPDVETAMTLYPSDLTIIATGMGLGHMIGRPHLIQPVLGVTFRWPMPARPFDVLMFEGPDAEQYGAQVAYLIPQRTGGWLVGGGTEIYDDSPTLSDRARNAYINFALDNFTQYMPSWAIDFVKALPDPRVQIGSRPCTASGRAILDVIAGGAMSEGPLVIAAGGLGGSGLSVTAGFVKDLLDVARHELLLPAPPTIDLRRSDRRPGAGVAPGDPYGAEDGDDPDDARPEGNW